MALNFKNQEVSLTARLFEHGTQYSLATKTGLMENYLYECRME